MGKQHNGDDRKKKQFENIKVSKQKLSSVKNRKKKKSLERTEESLTYLWKTSKKSNIPINKDQNKMRKRRAQ